MTSIIHVRIYDYITYIEDGFITFDDKGILEVGDMKSFKEEYQVIEGEGKLLIPALINFHTHMYSSFARGFDFRCTARSFKEMLEQVWWKLDAALTLEDVYWSAIAHGIESLEKGVVGVIDHHASGAILGSTDQIKKAMKDIGLHGTTCFESSDRFELKKTMDENVNQLTSDHGFFGLHASMTLSDESLKEIRLSSGKSPIHCHVSESYEDQVYYELSPVKRLDQHDLLKTDSLLAHCVHIDSSDAARISDRNCTVVINARSNQNNSVGATNFALLKKYKIPVVVGTDGLGSDIAKSWQALYYMSKSQGAESAYKMSLNQLKEEIINSYDYYNRITGIKLGRFEKGYRFDAILVDYKAITPLNESTIFAHLFYGVFDHLNIVKLWSGASLLVENGDLINSPQIPAQVVKSLWKRIEATYE